MMASGGTRRVGLALLAALAATLVFAATALATSKPKITVQRADHITETGANLRAKIQPSLVETTWRIVVEDPCGSECIEDVEVGHGTIAAKVKKAVVSAMFANLSPPLEPGKTYHFRVIATNEKGTNEGAGEFTTKTPRR